MTTTEILGTDVLYDDWLRLSKVRARMPDGAVVAWHVEDHGDAVGVLPYDLERGVALLVTQPRLPVLSSGEREALIEVIAGRLDGVEPEHRVREEAMEEAGVRLGALEPVAVAWSMPAISTERIHLYLARYTAADRTGIGGGAEGEPEYISVLEMPIGRLRALAMTGGLTDAKTLILVQALLLRAGDGASLKP